jgi:hypothetical protein
VSGVDPPPEAQGQQKYNVFWGDGTASILQPSEESGVGITGVENNPVSLENDGTSPPQVMANSDAEQAPVAQQPTALASLVMVTPGGNAHAPVSFAASSE